MFPLSLINGKDWSTWTKKYLMVDYYMHDKVLGKIKEIKGIEQLIILRFWLIKVINFQMIKYYKKLLICVIKDIVIKDENNF